ncbi:MAG TPA: hypothetical protein VGM37_04335 [Armatimonadota bacterium]|jgi:hypothetical protein
MNRRALGLFTLAALPGLMPAAWAAKPTVQRFALTRYFYGYQADTRKPLAPGIPTLGSNGESLFSANPMVAIGPWFGYGHAMWHRSNFTQMRRAGIDVALPVFRADSASLSGYAEQGLDSLAQALIELKRDRQDYPLIGMFYDTTSLAEQAKPLDVSSESGRAAFYDPIARFFRHVPEEFRALAQTPDGLACILAVGTSTALTGESDALRAYCNDRFRQEFGRRLLWVGEADWHGKDPGLDAYASFNEGRGLRVDADGPISVATIGAGYNDTANGSKSPAIRSRDAGLTMIDDWRSLFKQKADWIVVETWNDYAHGSAVAPTRSYGVRDCDEMLAGLLQFRGESGYPTQAMRVNAPESAPPKAVVPIEIVVQNGSLEQWGRGNISFSASWYQNGQMVEEGPKIPIIQPVPTMGMMTLPIAAVTARGDGQPLPDGDYELRVEFFRSSIEVGKPAFTPFTAPVASIPIRIGKAASEQARLITTDLSPWVMAGEPATAHLIVRNDGATAWPKGKTRLAWTVIGGPDASSSKPVASGAGEPLAADVNPGDTTPVLNAAIVVPRGTPGLPAGAAAGYSVQWTLQTPSGAIPVSEAPGITSMRPIRVLDNVQIAHFPFGSSAPASWEADTDLDIRTVVRNIGPATWKASDVKIGYHWFYWDGTEALWDGAKTALPKDVKPGEDTLVHVKATAPPFAGAYVFSVDVWDGKEWVSTLPATAGFDTSMAYVNVTGGNLRPVDLTGLFDVDGIAGEVNPGDGEFADGQAFPGEQVPPDVQPPLPLSNTSRDPYPPGIVPILYPAGYFGPVDTVGRDSIRRVAFRYPGKKDGDRNFILGRGQMLPLGVGSYNRVWLLAAATKDTEGSFRLNYSDGSNTDVPMKFSSWTAGPQHNETVGLVCSFRRSAKADDATGKAYLYVYDLTVDPTKTLQSITLPENRAFRVAAITADQRPSLRMPTPVK